MDTLTLTIDGHEVKTRRGSSVLDAALDGGVYIPNLCSEKDLEPTGGCRLCVVEIDGVPGFAPSCEMDATDNMVVRTNTPQLQELRRQVLELIFTEHPRPCMECWRRKRCGPDDICLRNVQISDRCVVCPKNERCDLQKVADYMGMKKYEHEKHSRNIPLDLRNPFYGRDLNKCILCAKCGRVCREIRGVQAIDVGNVGFAAHIGSAGDKPVVDYNCISCGACVSKCPVGALFLKDDMRPESEVRTTCTYCGVGCGIKLGVSENKIVSVWPDKENEVNRGYLCVKGHFGIMDMVQSPDRIKTPLIRNGGGFRKASWDEALDLVAAKLRSYPSDQVAVISSSKCTNEDNYVAQKLARVALGTNNVDQCARL